MGYRVKNTKILAPEQLVAILHRSAILYSEYVNTTLLFIFREKKSDEYDYYEVRFGKNNFMHLAGIKSEAMNAVEFYEACMEGAVTKEVCNPRRDATTMYSSYPALSERLGLENKSTFHGKVICREKDKDVKR